MSNNTAYLIGDLSDDIEKFGGEIPSSEEFYILAGKLCRLWRLSELPAFDADVFDVHMRLERRPVMRGCKVVDRPTFLAEASLGQIAREIWSRISGQE